MDDLFLFVRPPRPLWPFNGSGTAFWPPLAFAYLAAALREKIHDGRFLNLVDNLIKAGYLEEWKYRPTLSGTPQGGIISPLLANIYLACGRPISESAKKL